MGLYMEKQKIENWKVLRSEYIAREPWFTARRDEVQLPNGNVIPAYYVLEYPAWICVIALTKEGGMIMERQYRHGIGRVDYELCAGVVDPTDASPLEAAKRELLEETGFGNGEWQSYMIISASPGVEKVMERHLEPTEDIVVEVLRPEQVRTLLLKNEIIQATHAAPLWKYFAENR